MSVKLSKTSKLDGTIMTIEEIKFIYDTNENMTLSKLSKITGELEDDLYFLLTCTEEEYKND